MGSLSLSLPTPLGWVGVRQVLGRTCSERQLWGITAWLHRGVGIDQVPIVPWECVGQALSHRAGAAEITGGYSWVGGQLQEGQGRASAAER